VQAKVILGLVGFFSIALTANEALAGRPSSAEICMNLSPVADTVLKYRAQGVTEDIAGLLLMSDGGYAIYSTVDANLSLSTDDRQLTRYAYSLAIFDIIKTAYNWPSGSDANYKAKAIPSCMVRVQQLFDSTGR